ncbi:hypothetical protein KIN20_004387 [Parelaphostrongylus tenuis]|uniref:Uncharacterized protein n=1 Tax=Parelaphostrongylus tenuis TaxID=148309 RepID=A0AAD5MRA4_PARTN|nr:hypothetical protein KIN20_004387 [Parelaphostrongylus tenuis]
MKWTGEGYVHISAGCLLFSWFYLLMDSGTVAVFEADVFFYDTLSESILHSHVL